MNPLYSLLLAAALSVAGPTASGETPPVIEGPQNAPLGRLCVFSLSDATLPVGWTMEPDTEFYVDSSKKAVVFASNQPGVYTIIAATVIGGEPVPLKMTCHYGVANPGPNPDPKPEPLPPVPETLKEWVAQKAPADTPAAYKRLAEVYTQAASGLERGTIRSADAAYSTLRRGSQTAVNAQKWSGFFDELEPKIVEGGEGVKALAATFREVADGLATLVK